MPPPPSPLPEGELYENPNWRVTKFVRCFGCGKDICYSTDTRFHEVSSHRPHPDGDRYWCKECDYARDA